MKILFLCVGNSARSQMAEGLARHILGPEVMVQSAGSKPSRVHPLAIQVAQEAGIDLSQQRSKSVKEIDPATVDTVITLCAEEECPVFLGKAKRIHWGLPDPARPGLTQEEQRQSFQDVFNELKKRIEQLR